jgi:hypothetical protein
MQGHDVVVIERVVWICIARKIEQALALMRAEMRHAPAQTDDCRDSVFWQQILHGIDHRIVQFGKPMQDFTGFSQSPGPDTQVPPRLDARHFFCEPRELVIAQQINDLGQR